MSEFMLSPGQTEQSLIALSQTHNLERYDFSLVPSLDRNRTLRLFDEDFVGKGRNAMLFGGPGTGKTFLLYCLGGVAARRGKTVRILNGESMEPIFGGDALRPDLDIVKLARGELSVGQREAKVRLDLVHCDLLLLNGLPRLCGSDAVLTFELLAERFKKGRSTFIVSRDLPRFWLKHQLLGEDTFVKFVKLHMGFFVYRDRTVYKPIVHRIAYPLDEKLTHMYRNLEIAPLSNIHPRKLLQVYFGIPEAESLRPWKVLQITEDSLRCDPRVSV